MGLLHEKTQPVRFTFEAKAVLSGDTKPVPYTDSVNVSIRLRTCVTILNGVTPTVSRGVRLAR